MSKGKTLRRPRDRAKNQQRLHTLHPWMYTAHLQVGPHQDASRLFHNIHRHYVLLCTLPCFSCCSVLPTHKIVWDSCLPFYKGKASHTLTSKSNGVWSSSSSPKNSLLVFCSTPRGLRTHTLTGLTIWEIKCLSVWTTLLTTKNALVWSRTREVSRKKGKIHPNRYLSHSSLLILHRVACLLKIWPQFPPPWKFSHWGYLSSSYDGQLLWDKDCPHLKSPATSLEWDSEICVQ